MSKKLTSKDKAVKKAAVKKPAAVKKSASAVQVIRLRMPSRRPIEVEHLVEPPTFVKPKKIHPRHLLPLIREGMEREFHSQTPQAVFHPLAAAGPLAASDELKLVTNTELIEPGRQQTASNVGEPSVAINGQIVFYTGNWYAAVSVDGGRTFKFINPAKSFPDPKPGSSFCCDQIVHYISKIDTFVWLLQYGPDTGNNIQRLAFAKSADVVSGKWRLFDITTASLKVGGAFMDFPDLAVGANNLYVTTNIFGPGSQVGSAVVRIPFSGIESGQVTARPFVSMDFQSFRVAQNCGTTAFFAAHRDTSTLAVFSWKEGQNTPVQTSVGVARWIGGNGYVSRTPDGRRWLDRADPRLTGATMANPTLSRDELWFAWAVDQNSNHRPNPFVQIARIDATNLTLIDNINVFDAINATCYGALSTNEKGEVGISYMIGGKELAPSHVVGILTGTRKDLIVAKGNRGPFEPGTGKGEWGDYLTVRRVFPNQKLFAATGFTMKGPGDGSNRDATPRFVVFGRAGDTGTVGGVGGVGTPTGGGTTGTGGTGGGTTTGGAGGTTTGGTGGTTTGGSGGTTTGGSGGTTTSGGGGTTTSGVGAPFKDVNTLPVVNPAVAAKIKAAATAEGKQQAPADETVPLKLVGGSPLLATKPGVERWPVKTGTDKDVARVGKNIIGGKSLGAGIVPATVEELILFGRPPGMRPATSNFDSQFHDTRLGVVEQTVWVVKAEVTVLKLEADGDYHLVLQGASGETMVAECPTPTKEFVGTSPWLNNIKAARAEIDTKLVSQLSPANFVEMNGTLVPRESLPESVQAMAKPVPAFVTSFVTPEENQQIDRPTFKTKVAPTPVEITGVGFFDMVHGQTGGAEFGIELHAILRIKWL